MERKEMDAATRLAVAAERIADVLEALAIQELVQPMPDASPEDRLLIARAFGRVVDNQHNFSSAAVRSMEECGG